MPDNDFEGDKKKTHRKKHAGSLNNRVENWQETSYCYYLTM